MLQSGKSIAVTKETNEWGYTSGNTTSRYVSSKGNHKCVYEGASADQKNVSLNDHLPIDYLKRTSLTLDFIYVHIMSIEFVLIILAQHQHSIPEHFL